MVTINNGVNRSSFVGEPEGFVDLPKGSMFMRRGYEYWKKTGNDGWNRFTSIGFSPTQVQYEQDSIGKIWFKTTSELRRGWTYIGIPTPTTDSPYTPPQVDTGVWNPGQGTEIDGYSLVTLTVSNENNALDDSWDFKVDGNFVLNYDGGGSTTTTFFTHYSTGETHSLSAECVINQSDNLFQIYIHVNGSQLISTQIYSDGEIGEVQELGTFTT